MNAANAFHTTGTESSDALLKRLIASQDGVRPEDVTIQYVRQQRANRLYPQSRYAPGLDRSQYETPKVQLLLQNDYETIKWTTRQRLAAMHAPLEPRVGWSPWVKAVMARFQATCAQGHPNPIIDFCFFKGYVILGFAICAAVAAMSILRVPWLLAFIFLGVLGGVLHIHRDQDAQREREYTNDFCLPTCAYKTY